jgi:hypothetical protein
MRGQHVLVSSVASGPAWMIFTFRNLKISDRRAGEDNSRADHHQGDGSLSPLAEESSQALHKAAAEGEQGPNDVRPANDAGRVKRSCGMISDPPGRPIAIHGFPLHSLHVGVRRPSRAVGPGDTNEV